MKIFLTLLLFSSAAIANTCPPVTEPNNLPSTVLPANYSSLLEVYDPGIHYFRSNDSNSNVRWVIEIKQFSTPISCNFGGPWDASSHGYQMLYCQSKANSTDILAIYGSSQDPLTCSSGYSMTNGYCSLVDPTQCAAMCDDGFPENIYGYEDFCDRPHPKLCGDGSYVRADIGVCPTACSDQKTCLDYAKSQNPCPSNNVLDFYYVDPSNWSISCTTIADTSPDHTENGGNADGNNFNDPGSTPGKSVSDLDPQSFAENIDRVLEDDFSNIERAVREGIKKESDNAQAIIQNGRDNIKALINAEGASADGIMGQIEASSDEIVSAINQLNNPDQEDPHPSACDPESEDYQACITPASPMPSHSNPTSIAEAHTKFWSDMKSSPIYSSMENIATIIPSTGGQCQKLIIDLREVGWGLIESNFHCELAESVRPFFQAFMLAYFTVVGFRIFAGA
jgi:hypothetical protein